MPNIGAPADFVKNGFRSAGEVLDGMVERYETTAVAHADAVTAQLEHRGIDIDPVAVAALFLVAPAAAVVAITAAAVVWFNHKR